MNKIILIFLFSFSFSFSQDLKCFDLTVTTGNLFEVDIELNETVIIPFLVDCGASESSVPGYIIQTLIKSGKIKETDLLESREYLLADGSTIEGKRIMIRRIKIGNLVLEDVEVSVSNSSLSPALIGQNLLRRLGIITLNYNNSTLCYKN